VLCSRVRLGRWSTTVRSQPWSEHRTYAFHISTRDLARFGQVYLNAGRHADRQVIASEWVAESTRAHTPTGRPAGGDAPAYGYLWWVAQRGSLFAGRLDRRRVARPPGRDRTAELFRLGLIRARRLNILAEV
jgi:CubicO group peptidase (beta-lactamase class C family)